MPYDAQYSMIQLEVSEGVGPLLIDRLNYAYPDLHAVWDELDRLRLIEDATVPTADYDAVVSLSERALENLEEMRDRMNQLDEMVQTLARMDAADPLIEELHELSTLICEGSAYAQNAAEDEAI
jgi:hypothetical protein